VEIRLDFGLRKFLIKLFGIFSIIRVSYWGGLPDDISKENMKKFSLTLSALSQ
jgi:hypothetical protein